MKTTKKTPRPIMTWTGCFCGCGSIRMCPKDPINVARVADGLRVL